MCFIYAQKIFTMMQKRKQARLTALAKAKKKSDLKKFVDSFLLPLTSKPSFDLRSEFPRSLHGERLLPAPPQSPA